MWDYALEILKQYGLAGLVMAALGIAYLRERSENRTTQAARIEDMKAVCKLVETQSACMTANTIQTANLAEVIRSLMMQRAS